MFFNQLNYSFYPIINEYYLENRYSKPNQRKTSYLAS
jgi:hypothetical protein